MNGPSDETLGRLAGMLPSMANGVAKGDIGGRGLPVIQVPRFACPACLKMFGQKAKPGEICKSKVCKACKWELKGGATIFICDDKRYAIMRPLPSSGAQINPKFVGQIVKIPVEAMDTILKSHENKPLTKN